MTGVRLTLEGAPARKNDKHRVWAERNPDPDKRRTMGRALTPAYEAFRDSVRALWLTERHRSGAKPIERGEVAVTITAYWPTLRHLDVDVPWGDIDAPAEVVLDALQYAGVYDDDVRVVRLVCDKYLDRDRPRLEMWVRPVTYIGNVAPTEEEVDAAVVALERVRAYTEDSMLCCVDADEQDLPTAILDYIDRRIEALRGGSETP
jgi:Holliday junction resolvase RusA-like endonuclease